MRPLVNALLYFPSRTLLETPAAAGLGYEDVTVRTADGQRLHAWWVPAPARPARAHVLLLHGNAGNIGDRVLHARLLVSEGFDVFLVDYRGYGRSTGRPSERGSYEDARAACAALRAREPVDPRRVLYLGESLGGAVALWLALQSPPAGLVLQSTFTGVRDLARLHYPVVPPALVPDVYPSLRRIAGLRAPLLLLHGDRDDIVPPLHADALYDAAPEPKRRVVFEGAGHNDLLLRHGPRWAQTIAAFADRVAPPRDGRGRPPGGEPPLSGW